jgi:hypothetical protein
LEDDNLINGHVPVWMGFLGSSIYYEGNKLMSMQGFPLTVGYDVTVHSWGLESLKGCPVVIGVGLDLRNSGITNLIGLPVEIQGDIKLNNCIYLESLEGIEPYYHKHPGGKIYITGCEDLRDFRGLDTAKDFYLDQIN